MEYLGFTGLLQTSQKGGVSSHCSVESVEDRVSSLVLSSLPSAPLPLDGLNPVTVFMPLQTSLVLLYWSFHSSFPVIVLCLSNLDPQESMRGSHLLSVSCPEGPLLAFEDGFDVFSNPWLVT